MAGMGENLSAVWGGMVGAGRTGFGHAQTALGNTSKAITEGIKQHGFLGAVKEGAVHNPLKTVAIAGGALLLASHVAGMAFQGNNVQRQRDRSQSGERYR